jgi:TolA-binding protein
VISCRAARARMLDVARRGATEAVSLEMESHIERCAPCEDERARWRLLGLLKDEATPILGDAAERRILSHLLEEAGSVVKPAPTGPRWRRPVLASVAAGVTMAVVAAVASHGLLRLGPATNVAEGQQLEGRQIEAVAPGMVSFAGADVRYGAGARMILHPRTRTLVLSAGQADVEVTPGLRGRFRVATLDFVVEVIGTRFIVTPESVRTLRGRVRILDRQDRELAVLTAGTNWTVSEARVAGAPPAAPRDQEAEGVQLAGAGARHTDGPPSTGLIPPSIPASALLVRSRAALASGESRQARSLAQRALAAHPTTAESATSQLLLAEALLIERRPDEAIQAYRRVVRRCARTPEAEVAEFAIAQLLLEQSAYSEAQVALRGYLARYPQGRFVREAREHLSLIQSGP